MGMCRRYVWVWLLSSTVFCMKPMRLEKSMAGGCYGCGWVLVWMLVGVGGGEGERVFSV